MKYSVFSSTVTKGISFSNGDGVIKPPVSLGETDPVIKTSFDFDFDAPTLNFSLLLIEYLFYHFDSHRK